MPTTVDDVISKTMMVEIEPKDGTDPKGKEEEMGNETEPIRPINDAEKEKLAAQQGKDAEETKDPTDKKLSEEKEPKCEDREKQEVPVEVEPKTGVSFPIKLEDRKQLTAIGLRKKSMLGMGIKVYAFGIIYQNLNKHFSLYITCNQQKHEKQLKIIQMQATPLNYCTILTNIISLQECMQTMRN